MADRPGIMIYFDMVEPLKRLDYTGKGRLFEAMLNYGQYGEVPDFNGDGMLMMAWEFILPKLNADEKSYRKKVIKNTYSSYCNKAKKSATTPMDFDEWCAKEGIDTTEWCRMTSTDIERYPNTTPNTETSSITKTETYTDGKPKAKVEVDGEGKGEEEPFTLDREKYEAQRKQWLAEALGK